MRKNKEESKLNIPLSQMIQKLRKELEESRKASEKESLRFSIESIELELKVAMTRGTSGKGGV